MAIDTSMLPIGGVKGPTPKSSLPRTRRLARAIGMDSLPRRMLLPLWRAQFQEHAGSCTAHGFGGALESYTKHQTGASVDLSRMDIYYGGRLLEGENAHKRDGGAYLHHVARWIGEYGTCSEAAWPYDPSRVTTDTPPEAATLERPLHRVGWSYLKRATQVAAALAGLDGLPARPVAIGRGVYANTERVGQTGVHEGVSGAMLGGHCTQVVGYDRDFKAPNARGRGAFLEMNSWSGWGTAHPTLGDDVPSCFAWIPFGVWENDFVWEAWAPLGPLAVEV